MWDILVFFFTSVPYNTSCPLLYSLTNIVTLKHMEFYFSLSITITDFAASTQMLSLTQKNLPKVFWAHLHIYQSFFTVLRVHGFMRTLWAELWSAQPRVRIEFLGTEVKRKPAAHQWWILVLFPEGARMFAGSGYFSRSIWMQDIGNAFSVRKSCRQRSEMHFLSCVWIYCYFFLWYHLCDRLIPY